MGNIQAPKDITHRSPLVKVPMRERILTSIKKNPGIAHSALRKKFTRSTEEGKKFDNAIGDLLVENLVVSTSVKWTGPYGLKTTYRIVGAKAAATEVAPVHGQHPAKTVVLGVEAAPKPVLSPAPPVVTPALPKTEPQPKPEPKPEPKPQPKPEAKPITREEVAAVQKMIKPEKFPTGNRCFACVDEDHVRVCGETASVTYKQVRLCRTHMNRLFYARKLYVRTSLKHNPILLKKT